MTPAKSLLATERKVWTDQVGGTLAGVMEGGGGRIDLTRAGDATATLEVRLSTRCPAAGRGDLQALATHVGCPGR